MNKQNKMPSSIERVGLLGATFSTGNMGVGALAMGSLRCIFRAFPDTEVSFLDYDNTAKVEECTIEEKKRRISLINLRFSKKLLPP